MKKLPFLIIGIILAIIAIAWRFFLASCLPNFYQFYDWIYFLVVPICYCFVVFFSKNDHPPLKIIAPIFLGVLIPILLSGFDYSSLQKILPAVAGATAIWIVAKILEKL